MSRQSEEILGQVEAAAAVKKAMHQVCPTVIGSINIIVAVVGQYSIVLGGLFALPIESYYLVIELLYIVRHEFTTLC